jgi:FkbM family methyltransferase
MLEESATKMPRFIGRFRKFISELKLYKTLPSFFTLSVLPRILKGLNRLCIPIPSHFTAILPDGSKIVYPVFFSTGIKASINDIYTHSEYFLLKSYIPKKGDIVIDCGAYIGLYSIICSKLCGDQGLVVSIEPEPNNFGMLQRNIKENRLNNIRLFNIALADRECYVEFFVPKVSASGSTFYNDHLEKQEIKYSKTKVKTTTFDSLIKSLNVKNVDIAKIDVEGAELSVLYGARESLQNSVINKLVIEVHKTVVESRKIIQFLIDSGYIIDGYFDVNKIKGLLYAVKGPG